VPTKGTKNRLAFGPDGRRVFTESAGWFGISAARLWDVDSGRATSPVLDQRETASGARLFSPVGSIRLQVQVLSGILSGVKTYGDERMGRA
jgi:hypothetical protein